MPEPPRLTQRARLSLVLVLFIAGFMRFSQPGILLLDDNLILVLTTNMVSPMWLVVAGLNTAAVGVLWWIGWRQFNFTVALVAALTLALNPWALALSHAVSFVGLLLPLLVVAGVLAFADSYRWRLVGIGGFVAVLLLAAVVLDFTPLSNTALPQNVAHMIAGTGLEHIIAPPNQETILSNLPERVTIEAVFIANVPRPDAIWLLFLGSATAVGLAALWFSANRRAALLIYGSVALPLLGALLQPALILALLPGAALLIGAAVTWLLRLLPGGQITRLIVLAAWAAILLSQALWWRGALRYIAEIMTTLS